MQVVHEHGESQFLRWLELQATSAVAKPPAEPNSFETRPRWEGPLSARKMAQARREGVPLSYDPAQNGWVSSAAPDLHDDPDLPIWACLSASVLRPWQDVDVDLFHSLLDDPALWRYMVEEVPKPFTKAVAADLITISNAGDHHAVRAITTAWGPVGQVRMLWVGPELQPEEAEVSYWLGRSFRGRGWATDAVKQMVSTAFRDRPGLRRVVAYVHPDNTASARVLLRAGFQPSAARVSDGWLGFACIPQPCDRLAPSSRL